VSANNRNPDEFAREVVELGKRISEMRDLEQQSQEGEALLLELTSAHEELRVAEEALRAQEEELNRVTHHQRLSRWQHDRLLALLPAPVLVTDPQGLVISANAAAASVLNRRLDHLLRKPIAALIAPADRAEVRRLLDRAAVVPDPDFRVAVMLQPKRADALPVDLVASVGHDEVGAVDEITWMMLTPGGPTAPGADISRREALARAIVELTALPLYKAETQDVLTKTAHISQRGLGQGISVSVSVGPPAEPELVASTDDLAQQIDGAQMRADEGPCQSAWEDSASVTSSDIRSDPRWPRLHRCLDYDTPIGAVAAPIRVGDDLVGALNVYSPSRDVNDQTFAASVELLGTAVAAVLHEIAAKSELEAVASQLRTALTSRATIEQAKGMIMAERGCSADEAFEHLAKISNDRNRKLRDIAAALVENPVTGRPVIRDD
jgi:PAS domain-containing protein